MIVVECASCGNRLELFDALGVSRFVGAPPEISTNMLGNIQAINVEFEDVHATLCGRIGFRPSKILGHTFGASPPLAGRWA